jgi:hypothetical protein
VCRRKDLEEALEAGGGRDDEEPPTARHNPAVRVWDASREVKKRTRPDAEMLFATAELVLAIDDVKQLVLVGVDVQRRVEQRRQLLPDRYRATASGRRSVAPAR